MIIELYVNYQVRFKLNVLYVDWSKKLRKWYWLPDHYKIIDQERVSSDLLKLATDGYKKFQWARKGY